MIVDRKRKLEDKDPLDPLENAPLTAGIVVTMVVLMIGMILLTYFFYDVVG